MAGNVGLFNGMKYQAKKGGVFALLGPTNTGKTTRAIERMLSWQSGVIGFPLRLLARENYELLCRKVGAHRVALITGEEQIIPPLARYYVATVESMPLSESFDFLAVDEIQMIADPHRGHVFSDRLLYHRGLHETIFIGSSAVASLLERLLEEVEILHCERLSSLDEIGYQKMSSLPKRSAVVAFSAKDVYQIGDHIRKSKGGVSVVMGTMSPEARKHQVDMFQAGEVDYLVATDAIGMGLNLTIDHVAFSTLYKFDGERRRPLRVGEVGQIAGRAGRGERAGTFGTTGQTAQGEILSAAYIKVIKENNYPAVGKAFWRNPHLSFASPKQLLQSLRVAPPSRYLQNTISVDDEDSLKNLMGFSSIKSLATNLEAVRRLWDVCQIPDYEKQFRRKRLLFLEAIFIALNAYRGRLPNVWVDAKVKNLEKVESNLYEITQSLGRVRTWSYIAHQSGWLEDGKMWQQRLLWKESYLSRLLHQCLVDRFVTNASVHSFSREDYQDLQKKLTYDETLESIVLQGRRVASLRGLSVDMSSARIFFPRKQLHKWLQERANYWLQPLQLVLEEEQNSPHLSLDGRGFLRWREGVLGQFLRSKNSLLVFPFNMIFQVRVEWLNDEMQRHLAQKIETWLQKSWQRDFVIFEKMAARIALLSGEDDLFKKEANSLLESIKFCGGVLLVRDLHSKDMEVLKRLRRHNFYYRMIKWLPPYGLYVPNLMTPKHTRWRAMLLGSDKKKVIEKIPETGLFKLASCFSEKHRSQGKAETLLQLGFKCVGSYALRFDLYNRYRFLSSRKTMGEKERLAYFGKEDTEMVCAWLRSEHWQRDEKGDWLKQKKKTRRGNKRGNKKKEKRTLNRCGSNPMEVARQKS